jgi:hypothetical protein
VCDPTFLSSLEVVRRMVGALLYDNAGFERIGDYLQARG